MCAESIGNHISTLAFSVYSFPVSNASTTRLPSFLRKPCATVAYSHAHGSTSLNWRSSTNHTTQIPLSVVPLPVTHPLNRNKAKATTRNVREEGGIIPDFRLRHQSRQGYEHEGEAGDEPSEIGDEGGHDLSNEKKEKEKKGRCFPPTRAGLSSYLYKLCITYVNLSMLGLRLGVVSIPSHYKGFGESCLIHGCGKRQIDMWIVQASKQL
jgi:hypothetical protein